MFALRSWIVSTLRAILIVTILSNALVPIPVAALAPVPESKTDVSSIPHVTVGMTNKHLIFHSSSRHAYRQQDATPVVTETPTPESTPIIDTLIPDITDTPVPTLETTPTPTDTPIAIQTTASQSALPAISVTFSAEQTQAKIGDKVVFTLRISNTGELAITGLRFSNILPPEFQFISNNGKNVDFSPQTHEIIWISDASTILMPGESIILEYTVVITGASIESAQIVDSATLSADGLVEPLTAETTLFISNAGKSLTFLDSKGGTATGMEGRVSIKVPENGLNAPGAISVEEVTGWEGAPSLVFELGLESPKQVDAQSMTPQADSADLNVFPTLSPTETPIPSEEELATQTDDTSDSISEITATATTIPIDVTNNSAAEKSSGSSEHDRITSFDTIEAKFNKPVILTVSFDNIADLATLTADQAPYLVTLDESSNTWVQVPLQSIDPNSNTITAEVDHFSVWGVGIGSLTPQNGANILLYHKPYSDLFTGGVSYSFPIWTPPGRNGLAPNLALSYSSKTADGLLGDVQAPWAGMGWNIDTVEIARKITNGACSPCGKRFLRI